MWLDSCCKSLDEPIDGPLEGGMPCSLDSRRARQDGDVHAVQVQQGLVTVVGALVGLEAGIGTLPLPLAITDVLLQFLVQGALFGERPESPVLGHWAGG